MNPPMASMGLHALLTSAGQEKMLRQASFDGMEDTFSTSVDFLIAFAKEHPFEWGAFGDALDKTDEDINAAMEPYLDNDEPRAIRIVTATPENGLTAEQAEQLSNHKAPISQPVSDAMRQTVKEAKAAGEVANPGRFMQVLLTMPCIARTVLTELAGEETLHRAIDSLVVATPPTPTFDLESIQNRTRDLMDRMWPKIREETAKMAPEVTDKKDEMFEKNPDLYLERVNLAENLNQPIPDNPTLEKYRFMVRSGGCLRAAENEARIRKAPAVTLDHMFFSLLQEGLETTKFLDSKGVDWRAWREEMDAALPIFEDGPRWPPNARNLGMNMPDEKVYETLPSISEFTESTGDLEDVKEDLEQWQKRADEISAGGREREFSDLLWVLPCFNEPLTLAFRFLTRAGITKEEVEDRTDSRY